MATLAANSPRNFDLGVARIVNDHPVIADDIIYEGAFVGDNASGLARPLAAGDPFLGLASRQANNAGGAASAVDVQVYSQALIGPIAVVGFDNQNKIGDAVYASDDDTLTLTQGSNTLVGKIFRAEDVSATTAMVFIQADALRVDL